LARATVSRVGRGNVASRGNVTHVAASSPSAYASGSRYARLAASYLRQMRPTA